MKFAVVVFPGSNSDVDAYYAASRVVGAEASLVWHKDTDLGGADVVILPGGFAHGDYLRTGAIARFSPIMACRAVVRRARRPGARHLQRFPGAARSRPAAGRDGPQPGHQVHLAPSCGCASSRPIRRSRPPARPVRCCGCRWRTVKATTSPTPRCCAISRPAARSCSATWTSTATANGAGQPQRLAQQHRRHLQRHAQRRRPDAASGARLRGVAGQR